MNFNVGLTASEWELIIRILAQDWDVTTDLLCDNELGRTKLPDDIVECAYHRAYRVDALIDKIEAQLH